MIGLPTSTTSRRRSRGAPTEARSSPTSSSMAPRIVTVSSAAPPSFIMTYETAAHEILAEADLRVHPAGRRDNVPGREITQMAGDGGRADVDRHPVGDVDVAGPGGDDRAGTAVVLAAHRDRHRAAVGGEQLVDGRQQPVVE